MIDHEEEVRRKDYELLKEIAGDEVANRYASKENYSMRRAGFAIQRYSVVNFAKRSPLDFTMITIVALLLGFIFIWKYFTY
ncbi:hypothetical protein [Marinifilum flexuosum]|uniref:Uncharacterized protein n=1 Tax=Marinifilum flexuosum TaxID=1117708 RepID=A0A419WF22_9BACT|nr:hypothetical protein [Marinifilum flexuosum]RKD94091.1 hypothetical protein BXY64_4254 [Marinifilum flexuosum]